MSMHRLRDGCRTPEERAAYVEGLEDAAQRVRYMLKHQNFERDGPDDVNPYAEGFEVAAELANDLISEMAKVAEEHPLLDADSLVTSPPIRALSSPGETGLKLR